MGPMGCPETSVRNYYCSLRNSSEERSSPHITQSSPNSLRVTTSLRVCVGEVKCVNCGYKTWKEGMTCEAYSWVKA